MFKNLLSDNYELGGANAQFRRAIAQQRVMGTGIITRSVPMSEQIITSAQYNTLSPGVKGAFKPVVKGAKTVYVPINSLGVAYYRRLNKEAIYNKGLAAKVARERARTKILTAIVKKATPVMTTGDPEAMRRRLLELTPQESKLKRAKNVAAAKRNLGAMLARLGGAEKFIREGIFFAKREGRTEDVAVLEKEGRETLAILRLEVKKARAYLRVMQDNERAAKLKTQRSSDPKENARIAERRKLMSIRQKQNRQVAEKLIGIEFAPVGEKLTRDSILSQEEIDTTLTAQVDEEPTFLPSTPPVPQGEEAVFQEEASFSPGSPRTIVPPSPMNPKTIVAGGAGLLALLLLL